MATYQKFEAFTEHLAGGIHDLFGTTPGTDCDVCAVYLSNTALNLATMAVKADLAEITIQNGYTGPINITNNGTRSGGTTTFDGLSVQVAASGGQVGPFQHVVLMNNTPTSPADPLIGAWSRSAALTLDDGETFDIKFNNAAVGVRGNIFTLT